MIERLHLFNPFLLEKASDIELSDTINELANMYKYSDMIQDIVFNINLESDLLMIYGEMIARLTDSASLQKLTCDNDEARLMYEFRKKWLDEHDEKAPAIEYFKAQASNQIKLQREIQLKTEAMLTRFKKAYASLETKQNALKKKLDAIKYEE